MSRLTYGWNELKKSTVFFPHILSAPAETIFRRMNNEMINRVTSCYIKSWRKNK